MNVKITAPHGCITTTILLSDVIRIESCLLSFFGTNAYNLYIIYGKHQGDEFYTLLSYQHEKDMQQAYDTIMSFLKEDSAEDIVLELEPMRA